jgi:hypothetical protein
VPSALPSLTMATVVRCRDRTGKLRRLARRAFHPSSPSSSPKTDRVRDSPLVKKETSHRKSVRTNDSGERGNLVTSILRARARHRTQERNQSQEWHHSRSRARTREIKFHRCSLSGDHSLPRLLVPSPLLLILSSRRPLRCHSGEAGPRERWHHEASHSFPKCIY